MSHLEDIIGQGRAVRMLVRMLRSGRLPHALLFTGIDGSGRQTTARALAMTMNCHALKPKAACGRCRSCRQMLSGNHPDLVVMHPSGMAIKIDQIRDLRRSLRFAPVEGGYRVIIINDTQTMNLEASNALLKTLEEPPKNTHIVLTAPETSDLLDTIVSRCQHILFRPIPAEMIVETLQARRDMDKDTASAIAVLTHGSLGRALSCDAEQWMAWRREVIGRLRFLSSATIPSLFAFAEDLSRDTDRLNDALDLIRLWFRDILIWKYCRNHILNRDYLGDMEREAERLTAEDLLETIQVVSRTQDSISRNANRRLALDVMMLHLKAAGDARTARRAAA